jgi:Domain of unknown function (DUF397)
MIWKKSSFCADRQCVEVALVGADMIAVRDGKNIEQPHLVFNGKDWHAFLDAVTAGEYNAR